MAQTTGRSATGTGSQDLLKTKLLMPPSNPAFMLRPRLIHRLNQGIRHTLTAITAPAGSGKTTLLSTWHQTLSAGTIRLAWIRLDEGDNDPGQFWRYFASALEMASRGLGKSLFALLRDPQTLTVESALTRLINTIAGLDEGIVLVLDDYQVITAHPIHEAMIFLLNHAPPQLHFMIASRNELPFPLAKMRSKGQLLEIQASRLRFTSDETRYFIKHCMDLELADEDIALLEARTEGWITGLQLASLSLQEETDVSSFIASFTGQHHSVADYLLDEVLAQQPASTHIFLLATALPDQLTGSLCDALTQQANGQTMLETLEQSNVFLTPLDHKRQWYRYHQLFRDMLRQRLANTYPELLPVLHRRASDWYEAHGMMNEAIQHAAQVQDFEHIIQIIERAADSLFRPDRLHTLLGWLGMLPDSLVFSRPSLSLLYAWVLALTHHSDAVGPYIQTVEAAIVTIQCDNEQREMRGEVSAILATIALEKRDIPRAIALFRQALVDLPSKNVFLRGIVALHLAIAYQLHGKIAAAEKILASIQESPVLPHSVTIPVLINQAQLQSRQGLLYQAYETYHQTLHLIDTQGTKMQVATSTAMASVGTGILLYQWNDLDSAMLFLTRGIQQGEDEVNLIALMQGYITLAHLYHAKGDTARAYTTLERFGQQILDYHLPWMSSQIAAHQARLLLAQGDIGGAGQLFSRHRINEATITDTTPVQDSLWNMVTSLAFIRMLIAEGKLDTAITELEKLRVIAESARWTTSMIEILNLCAIAFYANGNTTEALCVLKQSLALAEPGGFIRAFADEGEMMVMLLGEVRDSETIGHDTIKASYLEKLLAASGFSSPSFHQKHKHEQAFPLIEPLSEREMEILRLIVTGMSNQEIAQELCIAVGTVKRHMHHICGKLHAHNRIQAVAHARTFGILS